MPRPTALHRGVYPIPARRTDNPGYVRIEDRPNLYDTLAEQNRIARIYEEVKHDLRVMWWQSFVRRACIAVALFAVVYFAVRGAF
jgi:hypothetical protein